jgi:hypothetical protein
MVMTPLLRELLNNCSRSGNGISWMEPEMRAEPADGWPSVVCAPAGEADGVARVFMSVTDTSLMVDDPMMIWSPSISSVLRMRAPLTNVPFRDARSSMMTLPPWVEIFACLRDTFSSSNSTSTSLTRPMTMYKSCGKGNSLPWSLPATKRSTYCSIRSSDVLCRGCPRRNCTDAVEGGQAAVPGRGWRPQRNVSRVKTAAAIEPNPSHNMICGAGVC